MQREEKQLIDALFQKISLTSAQSGPRDPEAEALINQHLRRLPGAAYYLAQTIIIQRQALKNAEAQIAELQRRGGRSGFLQGRPAPAPQPPASPQRAGGGGSFLAGAAETALGVAGGMFLAGAASDLIDGIFGGGDYSADDLFDAYSAGYEESALDDPLYEVGYEDAVSDVADDLFDGDFADDDFDLDDGW